MSTGALHVRLQRELLDELHALAGEHHLSLKTTVQVILETALGRPTTDAERLRQNIIGRHGARDS